MSLANYRIPQIEQPQSSLLQKPVSIKPFNNGPQLLSRAELERKPTLDSERSSSDTLYSIGNAVLNSAPALIQQIGNSPTEKSGRVARTLGIGLEGAKLGEK